MVMPVCDCGWSEVSALWMKVYPRMLYISGALRCVSGRIRISSLFCFMM